MADRNRIITLLILLLLNINFAFGQIIPYSDDSLLLSFPVANDLKQEEFNEIEIVSNDSIKISGFEKINTESNNLIIYFHGNGECLWTKGLQKKLKLIFKSGFSILAIDYPEYGKSKGKAIVDNLYRFADSTYVYAKTKYPEHNIIIWGQSLGTIPAIYLARNKEADLLISEGTITILPDLKNSLEKIYSTEQQNISLKIDSTRYFDNYEMIKGVKNRVVFIHGDNDIIAKIEYAKELYNGFDSNKKDFVVLKGVGHNYGSDVFKKYLKNIRKTVANEFGD